MDVQQSLFRTSFVHVLSTDRRGVGDRWGGEENRLTIGVGHSEFSLLEILHLVDDFVGNGFEFPHFGLQPTQTLLIRNGIVIHGICSDVHVQINGHHWNVVSILARLGVLEAYSQIRMVVSVDGETSFTLDVLLGKINVVVLGAIHHFDIDALMCEVERLLADDRGGDDDERIGKSVVPNAFGVGMGCCGKVEFDRRNQG